MKKLSIYLVDDHALFLDGIHFLLSSVDFIGEIYEARNGREFLDGLSQHPVDLVLLDIEMPVMNGLEAARQARIGYPDLKIIALSMYSDEQYYTGMIEAGVNGFLLKNSGFLVVKHAIKEVMNGKNYFSQEIIQALVKNRNREDELKVQAPITVREIEVLKLICEGFSNAEIADQMELSRRTVDKHRQNLLGKTHSKNTVGLVLYAIKYGYYCIV